MRTAIILACHQAVFRDITGQRHYTTKQDSATRRRPAALYADRAYCSHRRGMMLYARGIEPHLAKPREPHGSGLGEYRWAVERTLSWWRRFRRPRVRHQRRADIHEGFPALGCALICWKRLIGFCQAL